MMLHIGKKVPKGFRELPGGIHLGKGIWILKMEPIKDKNPQDSGKTDGKA